MAKVKFTAGRVQGFKCPPDKQQAFMWDASTPGLALRTTPNGQPSYIFQSVYDGKYVRVTIGPPSAWSIDDAQAKARELQRVIDEGTDPRDLKREAKAESAAKRAAEAARAAAEAARATTAREAWDAYVKERSPKWGEHHRNDHERLSKSGGETAKRGTRGRGVTIAGPLHPLLALPLRALDGPTVEAWAQTEGATRPTTARLAWRLLRAFLAWCAEHPEYSAIVSDRNPAKTKKAREALGKPGVKHDALMREQLAAWFAAVRDISNPAASAYLQTLLLTGARPGEVRALRWDDLNTQWKSITIRDKVEGERVIPLTPYVHQMLAALPRRNEWVFASNRTEDAPLTEPSNAHDRACKVAGIEGLTLHGLRRSFKSLTEWLDCPAGVVAQIMGHKPSAIAEKHYTVRPLDLLRLHHERIEAWILEQAGVQFDTQTEPGKLRAVS